eukprot:CAMPEP_0196644532 /NCGR_PEP_ID=MMETSP1085-20130531/7339_1 /TAXON_ID=41879 ORGANISM="Pycnococcus sp, Strain CCMP1998" /NCGR_SAMPLE_ID=MMETSP1085 /ASSEMBLY_ACC=CAM_ASM_000807 /LENGTH=91 /DNA_ID=CAMNT_0041974089 /DNA_START=136 /DNA_END=410 /DNA_ORIENTATION=-
MSDRKGLLSQELSGSSTGGVQGLEASELWAGEEPRRDKEDLLPGKGGDVQEHHLRLLAAREVEQPRAERLQVPHPPPPQHFPQSPGLLQLV